MTRPLLLFLFLFAVCETALAQQTKAAAFLIVCRDTVKNENAIINEKGDTIFRMGDVFYCTKDTIRVYDCISTGSKGLIGIDNTGKVLYQVHLFDNGPDYPSEGLFRIIVNGKYGFADEKTGKIVIQPRFDCAWPFENGRAKVSYHCTTIATKDSEYHSWSSSEWIYINKKGKKTGTAKGD